MDGKEKREISREEHIQMLQQRRKENVQKVCQKINDAYVQCVRGDEAVFQEIIQALDKLYKRMVWNELHKTNCYNEENEHTTLQEAHLAVWLMIRKSREENQIRASFASYCKGVYYYKVQDVIRSVLETKKRLGGQELSIEEELPDEGGKLEDFIADPQYQGNQVEIIAANSETSELFDRLFKIYCYALTQAEAEPQRELALYYSRVLPHVLHLYYGIETIPDKKAASPKWAMEKMKNKSIGTLGLESEKQMKQLISQKLFWCDKFWKQMERNMKTSSGVRPVKEVIYVVQFDEKQIGHMAEYMHQVVAKQWSKLVKKDASLSKGAMEYTVEMDKMSGLLRGGVGR